MLSTAGDSFGAGFMAIDPATEDETTLSLIEGLTEGSMFNTSRDKGIILGERLAQNLGAQMGNRVVYTMTDVTGEIVSGLARLSGIVSTGAPGVDAGDAGHPVLEQEGVEIALGPLVLASDHLIVVHGPQEGLWDLIYAAVETGFTVRWEGEEAES